jgi:hypothetical protein
MLFDIPISTVAKRLYYPSMQKGMTGYCNPLKSARRLIGGNRSARPQSIKGRGFIPAKEGSDASRCINS